VVGLGNCRSNIAARDQVCASFIRPCLSSSHSADNAESSASFAYCQNSSVFDMGNLMPRSRTYRALPSSGRPVKIAHVGFRLKSLHSNKLRHLETYSPVITACISSSRQRRAIFRNCSSTSAPQDVAAYRSHSSANSRYSFAFDLDITGHSPRPIPRRVL
jgi:hypothetical protein